MCESARVFSFHFCIVLSISKFENGKNSTQQINMTTGKWKTGTHKTHSLACTQLALSVEGEHANMKTFCSMVLWVISLMVTFLNN